MSGVICKNPVTSEEEQGNCQIKETVIAINLNGDRHLDQRGITYVSGKDVAATDPDKILSSGKLEKLDDKDKPVPAGDEVLYTTYISGENAKKDGKRHCISYRVPIRIDGNFELNIKSVEIRYDSKGQRIFNIFFNGQEIMKDIDLIKVSGGKGRPVEIFMPFRVSNNTHILEVNGLPTSQIRHAQADLNFCSGTRENTDGAFITSAFSIVELGIPEKVPDNPDVCSKLEFFGKECTRPGMFYIVAGGICRNLKKNLNGDCNISSVITAVNLNGNNHTDIHGVTYIGGKYVGYRDPHKIRRSWVYPEKLKEVPDADQELYKTHIWGWTTQDRKDKCVTYKVPVIIDGKYELSMKTMETWYRGKGARSFNVRFNHVPVLEEVDLVDLSGDKGVGIEFLMSFDVTHGVTRLLLKGHKDTNITGDGIDLAFCMGTLNTTTDSNFLMSAFKVIRFGNSDACLPPPLSNQNYGIEDAEFIRITKNSKYLCPSDIFFVKPSDGVEICKKMGLEPAMISTLEEFSHVVDDFVLNKNFNISSVLLGAEDKMKVGIYTDVNEDKPISFQLFRLSDSFYYVGYQLYYLPNNFLAKEMQIKFCKKNTFFRKKVPNA